MHCCSAGVSREVDNLIQENNELLATKLVARFVLFSVLCCLITYATIFSDLDSRQSTLVSAKKSLGYGMQVVFFSFLKCHCCLGFFIQEAVTNHRTQSQYLETLHAIIPISGVQ